jgi:hypothetical protein
MIYTIAFFAGSRPAGNETCRGALDAAKAIAIAAVDKGSADRAEIRDLHKHLLFHYPRTFPVG